MSYRRGHFTMHDLRDLVAIYGEHEDYDVVLWCPDIMSEFLPVIGENESGKRMAPGQKLTFGAGHSLSHPNKELTLIANIKDSKNRMFGTIEKFVEYVKKTHGELDVNEYNKFFLETMLEKIGEENKSRQTTKRKKRTTNKANNE